jgi:hypothetical protein
MRKISAVIIFGVGFLAAGFFFGTGSVRADSEAMTNNTTQVLNDEGYGNDDAEYYNSPDDVTNDEEPSGSQENASANWSNREY